MFSNLTLLLAAVAASATVTASLAMTENIGPLLPATGQMLFVIGPYAALGILVWVTRSHRLISLILFGFTLVLSCFDMYSYYVEYDHFLHRDTTTPGGSNWMPFLVAAAQWLVTIFLAVTVLPVFIYLKQKQKPEGGITNE